MSNELEYNLDRILEDKNTNLLPENLKKGVTCLGVEGTAETGTEINNQDKEITTNGTYTADEGYTGLGTVTVNVPQTGDVPVKLFETEEQMQADTTAKMDDLALVYREEIQNATVDSQFSVAKFPATVVLPEAITDYVDVMYRAVDDTVTFDCWGNLDSTMFQMSCYMETGELSIQYESSDGITYTRTDGGDETIDFGTTIYYPYTDMWNNVIGYFIQAKGTYFDGLYRYQAYPSSNLVDCAKNIASDGQHELQSVDLQPLFDFLTEAIDDNTLLTSDGLSLYTSSYGYRFLAVINSTTSYSLYSVCGTKYGTAISTLYCNLTSGASNEYEWYIRNNSGWGDNGIRVDIDISAKTITSTYITDGTGLVNTSIAAVVPITMQDSSITIHQLVVSGTDGFAIDSSFTTVYGYLIAPTQLTLKGSNELLPGKTAYGKNGVIEGDGSIWNEIPTSALAGCYNFPNVYTSGSYTVYGVRNDYKYYINRTKSTVPTRQLVYFKKDDSVDISDADAIGVDITNLNAHPKAVGGFSSDKSVYFSGLSVYDASTDELLKTYDGYAVIGNDRNTSRFYYYKKDSTETFQIYEVDLDDYENPKEMYSLPYGFTMSSVYVKTRDNSYNKANREDTIYVVGIEAGSSYSSGKYTVIRSILIMNMTKGTVIQAYSKTASVSSFSSPSVTCLFTDNKVGIQMYELGASVTTRRSIVYDYETNTSTISTDSDTVWSISDTSKGFEINGYTYFADGAKRYPLIDFDGETWSNVILDESGSVLANTTSSYKVYSAGGQIVFRINNKYYRLKSMEIDEANATTYWTLDTSVSYYLTGTYNNANFPDALAVSIELNYITELYDNGTFDILSKIYGRVKLDKLILTNTDNYNMCCIYISHSTSDETSISTYPTILTHHNNTISPAEYDTAMNTVDEILGEEV